MKSLKRRWTSAASNSSSNIYVPCVRRGAAPYKGVIGCLQIFQLFSVFEKKCFVAVLDCFETSGIPGKWLWRNLVTMASKAVPAFIRQDSIRELRAGEKLSSRVKRWNKNKHSLSVRCNASWIHIISAP